MYDFSAYPSPAGYFVAADGVQLPWFQYGEADAAQTIFLLNGFTCNQFNTAKVVAGLAGDYRITAPCLIVSGAKDLFALPLHSERVHQAVAGSWYVSVPGGTHNAVLENSEEMVEIVREFLAGKKAQSAS